MRRSALLAVAALTVSVPVFGQSTVAVPPSGEQLDRLRMKTEWSLHLPIDGQTDKIERVQVVSGGQVFAQTKSGTLLAIESQTGQKQWSFRFPSGHGTTVPVAVNSRYVFAANLSRLYCFHRYSGILEFSFEPTVKLEIPLSTITMGPICDESNVYVVLGYQEVLAFRLPSSITQPQPMADNTNGVGKVSKPKNPADEVANRYPGEGTTTAQVDPATRSRGLSRPDLAPNRHQVSPSISVLPSVTPPHEFKDRNGNTILRTESLTLMNSLRQPYQIRDGEGRYVLKTPSVTVIPPSIARAYELNDIRPKGLAPVKLWRYEATSRLAYEPVLAGPRMWLTFEQPRSLAFDRVDLTVSNRKVQTDGTLSGSASTGLVADGSNGYFALNDGSLISVDLSFGGTNNMGALKLIWRANIGGPMNRKPIITPSSVFVGGTNSGIGQVNRNLGELSYRTASEDDFLLAVNDDSIYTRNRNGTVRVYDLKSPTDPITHMAVPVGAIDLSSFAVPVTNTVTDRVFIASDSGLLVCLRDSAPKYAVAKPTLPVKPVPVKTETDAAGEKPAGDKPAADAPPAKPVDSKPMEDKKP